MLNSLPVRITFVYLYVLEESVQNRFTIDLNYLRTLRALRVLREHRTVTAAAAVLHLTPSAVSQQLVALSRSVGAPLLIRQGRGVRLTPQALVLLEHGEIVHAQLERAQADLARFGAGEIGVVTIGAFATAISGLVVPSLSILMRDRPGIAVVIEEIEAPECFSALDAGGVDLVITVDYAFGPGPRDPRYQRIELLRDPLRVVVPEGHRIARKHVVSLRELSEERWIVGTQPHPCSDITLAALATASVSPTLIHRTNDWQAVLSLVECGAGVALVPTLALDRRRTGVVDLRVAPLEPARNIYAAVRKGSEGAPHVAVVLDVLRAVAEQTH